MLTIKCGICGAEMRMTTPRYKVVFDSWLIKREKDICTDCFKRIADEIKQAATTQTERDAYWKELFEAVMHGEMSDADAHQAWYEYINKKDTPQTERSE